MVEPSDMVDNPHPRSWKHWSPTVPVSVWLPEPARDRGSKRETLNDDFYHTTSRGAAIFGVQGGLSYLVLNLARADQGSVKGIAYFYVGNGKGVAYFSKTHQANSNSL